MDYINIKVMINCLKSAQIKVIVPSEFLFNQPYFSYAKAKINKKIH